MTLPAPSASAVLRAVDAAAARLAAAGVPSPRHDAEILAAHLLGVPRGVLALAHGIDPTAYAALVDRRAAREPLQHIVGRAWFRGVSVAVGPGVFVPRPETEVVTGAAVEAARAAGPRPVVVDLCTGSGVIALAVADEVPGAEVHAVEADDTAYAWARRNLEGTRVHLHHGDAAAAARLLAPLAGRVDVVVANPPYIPLGAAIRDPEVAEHDPDVALWSGPDGLDAIRSVAAAAGALLRPGGVLVCEHADAQGEAAPAAVRRAGEWAAVSDHQDLAGRPRFVLARRPGTRSRP